ncbi:MAG: hypothetical protein DRN71_04470 [Candidatus Nanohalarchaeota archaeon]|nr:MAG: hypothetical protein DRN71_04470 [Candidatus Nanohaloarchaeota archaeon]
MNKTFLKGCAATLFNIFTCTTNRDVDSKIGHISLEEHKEMECVTISTERITLTQKCPYYLNSHNRYRKNK